MSVSRELRKLRAECGISQMEAAERLGVSRQTIHRWEHGEAAPSMENLRGMASLYGVTVDALLNGTPEKRPAADTAEEHRQEPAGVMEAMENHGRRWKRQLFALLLTVLCVVAAAGFLSKWRNRPTPMDQLESEVVDLTTAEELYLLPLE